MLKMLHPSTFAEWEVFGSCFLSDCTSVNKPFPRAETAGVEFNEALFEELAALFVLRRTLRHVKGAWSLPPLKEVCLKVPLTHTQRRIYLWLLTRSARLLAPSQVRKEASVFETKGRAERLSGSQPLLWVIGVLPPGRRRNGGCRGCLGN